MHSELLRLEKLERGNLVTRENAMNFMVLNTKFRKLIEVNLQKYPTNLVYKIQCHAPVMKNTSIREVTTQSQTCAFRFRTSVLFAFPSTSNRLCNRCESYQYGTEGG